MRLNTVLLAGLLLEGLVFLGIWGGSLRKPPRYGSFDLHELITVCSQTFLKSQPKSPPSEPDLRSLKNRMNRLLAAYAQDHRVTLVPTGYWFAPQLEDHREAVKQYVLTHLVLSSFPQSESFS
jgi:hypothetical protein